MMVSLEDWEKHKLEISEQLIGEFRETDTIRYFQKKVHWWHWSDTDSNTYSYDGTWVING